MLAALGYAERGWPVFPLHAPVLFGPKKVTEAGHAKCSCRQPTCESQGKHPRTPNGLEDATTDPEVIRSWWEQWPDANIGVRTGIGFDVLDLDGLDAMDALDDLAPVGAKVVVGPMVVTGLGVHIYVPVTGAGNRTAMGGRVGLDWRGAGGYVVAPPSLHYLHGDRYEWSDDYGIDRPLVAVPPWLDDLAHKRRQTAPPVHRGRTALAAGLDGTAYGLKALTGELGRLALAAEGTRNDALNTAAFSLGQLVAGGELNPSVVAEGLLTVATRIGLTSAEAVGTITSGMRAGMGSPRTAGAFR
jgi:hypothetical protein